MPHDVTMPQLGMAQDAGRIVAWLKAPGDAVAKGDALFEVETDKATMEVEAQASGYLTGVLADEGDDVPVGQVIARISDSAEDDSPAPAAAPEAAPVSDALPEGQQITMPQLGMAQDSGQMVGWLVELGAQVGPDDLLFEVETDKATMEVPAGASGYLAATLAQPGEDVAVGAPVAILTAEAPENPVARAAADVGPSSPPRPGATRTKSPATQGRGSRNTPQSAGPKGRAHSGVAQGAALGIATGAGPVALGKSGPPAALSCRRSGGAARPCPMPRPRRPQAKPAAA